MAFGVAGAASCLVHQVSAPTEISAEQFIGAVAAKDDGKVLGDGLADVPGGDGRRVAEGLVHGGDDPVEYVRRSVANNLNDPDGDGFTNEEEFFAGTSPLDNLQINEFVGTPAEVRLTVLTGIDSLGAPLSGREGGLYTLERFVSGGQWLDVSEIGPLDGNLSANEDLELRDPNPPAARGFYRVRLEFP